MIVAPCGWTVHGLVVPASPASRSVPSTRTPCNGCKLRTKQRVCRGGGRRNSGGGDRSPGRGAGLRDPGLPACGAADQLLAGAAPSCLSRWTATTAPIYAELAKLQAGGLVRQQSPQGVGNAKRYTITAAGRRDHAWVDSPLTELARSELMLRVHSTSVWSHPSGQSVRPEQRTRYQERLKLYTEEELAFAASDADLFVHDTGCCGFRHPCTLDRPSPSHDRVV